MSAMKHITLWQAIRLAHRLRNEPLAVRQTAANRWEYNPREDATQVAYGVARDRISRHPLIERLLKRWI